VETAWHYQHPARVTPIIARRQAELHEAVTDIAWAIGCEVQNSGWQGLAVTPDVPEAVAA
jgi:hypothetical protein